MAETRPGYRLDKHLEAFRRFRHDVEMVGPDRMRLFAGQYRPEDALNPCWQAKCKKCGCMFYVCEHVSPGSECAVGCSR